MNEYMEMTRFSVAKVHILLVRVTACLHACTQSALSTCSYFQHTVHYYYSLKCHLNLHTANPFCAALQLFTSRGFVSEVSLNETSRDVATLRLFDKQ